MEKRLECTISGRVQKVMFRDFTQRTARKLDVVGEVQNMQDGTVWVVAEGDEEKLRELLVRLRTGSAFSKVEKVVELWNIPTGQFTSFNIIYRSLWDRI